MNAQAHEVEAAAAPAKKGKVVEVETVTMEDGRKVDFTGKKKLVKDYILKEDGSLDYILLDFRNGTVRKIYIPLSLLGQFAGHGAIQKYGDELAGLKGTDGGEPDLDDMILAIDELDESIQAGKWSTRKEGDGMAGTSVLIKALIEFSGKTVEEVKGFLKDKDKKYKDAFRADDKSVGKSGKTMAQIVKEIEAAKLAKGPKIDTASELSALMAS
jgi:hypothetical protein